jgi:hypothetical protein
VKSEKLQMRSLIRPYSFVSLSFRLARNLSSFYRRIPDLPKTFGIAGIDMSQWLTRSMKMSPSPLSPPLKGGEILSPRPLGERVRVRGGIFGSMTITRFY